MNNNILRVPAIRLREAKDEVLNVIQMAITRF